MSCSVEIIINSNKGASSVIKLEVPDASEMSLEDAVGALMGNKEAYDEFIAAVNSGGFPLANFNINSNRQGFTLPSGNYNLNTIRNEFDTPNIRYLVDALQKEGVDLNAYNILLTDAKFSVNWNSNYGIFNYQGNSLAVIKPTPDHIETHLKQLYVSSLMDKAPKEVVDGLYSNIATAAKILATDPTTSRRAMITLSKIGYSDGKFVASKSNVVSAFTHYFYSSASLSDALYKTGLIGTFNKIFNDLIGAPEQESISYDNPSAQALIDRAKISGKYLKISRQDIESFMENHGYGEATEDNIVSAIQDINNSIHNGKFIDIAYISDSGLLLRNTVKKPVFDKSIVNTEYTGDIVDYIENYNGYNIIRYNNKYYISDKLITTADNIHTSGVDNLKHAKNLITLQLNRPINFESVATSIKKKSGDKVNISSSSKLEIGDRFSVLDITLDDKINLYNDKKLIKSITFNNFVSEMMKKPQYNKILTSLNEQGINIQSILDTPEKVATFFLLKNQLRDPETHNALYNNKVPSMLTPDKLNYETELITKALNIIENASESVYEVVAAAGDKYNLQKLQMSTNVPVHKKVPRSFKSEMVEIANHLGKNYGIKINVVTARELADSFKGVIPNVGRTNAFIYNGEIYLNVDRATTADSLHEFAHLIMGSIKRTNSDLYYGLVNQVEQLSDYDDKVQAFRNIGDSRAVTDLNEEIFVTEFGNYFSKIADTWFEGKETDLDALGELFKAKTQNTFQTSEDIKDEKLGKLLNMSIDDIMSEFGSALVNKDFREGFDMDMASESRVITNLIERMIKSGNLKEDC